MSRLVIQPHELDLETGGRRDYWVALEHDTMWGAQLIPVTVLVGPGAIMQTRMPWGPTSWRRPSVMALSANLLVE